MILGRRGFLTAVVGAAASSGCATTTTVPAPGRSHHRPAGRDRRAGVRPPPGDGDASRGTDGDEGHEHATTPGDGADTGDAGTAAPPAPPVLDLPARPPGAETGSAFLERTEGLGRVAMDDAIAQQILAGNVPAFLRRMVPIILVDPQGREAVLHVTCDYLAVGSDEDFVRMPMTSAAAQRIADVVGASLPTPRIVDAIWQQAEVRLPPSWIDGGPTEGTLRDYRVHNERLEQHRQRGGRSLGALTAGHKKDIVLCNRMAKMPGRVAIYGWHKADGSVVQPLSTRHSCRYADYSHGVRLVHERVMVDGRPHLLPEMLADPELAALLSDDGPLVETSYPTELPDFERAR